MFCPRCGNRQISEEIKFCSKCGFPLHAVAEILAEGGTLPELESAGKPNTLLTRRNGKIFGLFWMLTFMLLLTSIFGALDLDKLAGMSAATGLFGGLMIFLASIFFLEKAPKKSLKHQLERAFVPTSENHNLGAANQNFLPDSQSIPAQDYAVPAGNWRTPDTNELLQTPSVTENTTKLLQKEDK